MSEPNLEFPYYITFSISLRSAYEYEFTSPKRFAFGLIKFATNEQKRLSQSCTMLHFDFGFLSTQRTTDNTQHTNNKYVTHNHTTHKIILHQSFMNTVMFILQHKNVLFKLSHTLRHTKTPIVFEGNLDELHFPQPNQCYLRESPQNPSRSFLFQILTTQGRKILQGWNWDCLSNLALHCCCCDRYLFSCRESLVWKKTKEDW